jgi:hypothetical protein
VTCDLSEYGTDCPVQIADISVEILFNLILLPHSFPHLATAPVNLLKTKRRLLDLKTQFVPRSKHFSSRLQKPISLSCKWHKSLFVHR